MKILLSIDLPDEKQISYVDISKLIRRISCGIEQGDRRGELYCKKQKPLADTWELDCKE